MGCTGTLPSLRGEAVCGLHAASPQRIPSFRPHAVDALDAPRAGAAT